MNADGVAGLDLGSVYSRVGVALADEKETKDDEDDDDSLSLTTTMLLRRFYKVKTPNVNVRFWRPLLLKVLVLVSVDRMLEICM